MRTALLRATFIVAAAFSVASVGCTMGDLNLDITDPKVSFDTDVNVVVQGESVEVHLDAENVYLIDPGETPPAEHEDDAGHFQIYLDDLDSEPLLITAQVDVTVMIPEDTAPGVHKLKCRIHMHDGAPTDAVFEIEITVKAKVSTG
jgi:hypothetical protein